jgi:hypothetical protein
MELLFHAKGPATNIRTLAGEDLPAQSIKGEK